MTLAAARREMRNTWPVTLGPGGTVQAMPPAIASLTTRLYGVSGATRGALGRCGLVALLHIAGLSVLFWSENRLVPQAAALLCWIFINSAFLLLVRRPAVAAALSLGFVGALILLSQFKHDVLLMTVNFVDLMVIDADTFSFLMQIFPQLGARCGLAARWASRR